MHKTYWCGDDASRTGFALANEVAEFHERGGRIAESKECIGMLFDSKPDACLGSRDAFLRRHFCHSRVGEITFGFDAEPLQCPLSNAANHHRHICDYGLEFPAPYYII